MTHNEFLKTIKDRYHVTNISKNYISVALGPEITVFVKLYKNVCRVEVSSWKESDIMRSVGVSYKEALLIIESSLNFGVKMNKNTFCKTLFAKYHVEIIEEDYVSVSICPNRIVYVTLGEDEVVSLEIAVHILGYWQEESYDEMSFEDAVWIINNTLRYGA